MCVGVETGLIQQVAVTVGVIQNDQLNSWASNSQISQEFPKNSLKIPTEHREHREHRHHRHRPWRLCPSERLHGVVAELGANAHNGGELGGVQDGNLMLHNPGKTGLWRMSYDVFPRKIYICSSNQWEHHRRSAFCRSFLVGGPDVFQAARDWLAKPIEFVSPASPKWVDERLQGVGQPANLQKWFGNVWNLTIQRDDHDPGHLQDCKPHFSNQKHSKTIKTVGSRNSS